ncbi:hypothetical protein FNV43_RR05437 [Rhamnella rubrinervis]|uniref:Uncharacterized protein n=1 Tax=Rhamnella rubrinervis TaxID=2594499 RepID=A0A8K0HML8_9ROSA|nr:hypothetical protein FNV43_RR05437 [Rhamnella rubrinervis]
MESMCVYVVGFVLDDDDDDDDDDNIDETFRCPLVDPTTGPSWEQTRNLCRCVLTSLLRIHRDSQLGAESIRFLQLTRVPDPGHVEE